MDLDLPLRELKQLIDIVANRNLIDTFKLVTVFEFWSLLRSEYPEMQSMLYNNYCLLFQHNTLRQHFQNTSSIRPSKEVDSVPKQMCGSSYPVSNLTSEADLWKVDTHFFSDIAQLNGESKMNVCINFGVFKCCSLEIPFNNHGVCHFDFFFKFNDDLIFLFSEMLLKVQRKITIHIKGM